jgi:hypothetical protein
MAKTKKSFFKLHWDYTLLLVDALLTIVLVLLYDNTTFIPQSFFDIAGTAVMFFIPIILWIIALIRNFINKDLRTNAMRWIVWVIIFVLAIVVYLLNSNVNFLT